MVEYILIFVILLGAVALTTYIVRAISNQSERSDTLLASDYP
jgi:hypothetical protein